MTGSDSGIGRATAVALAEAGCDVGVTWHADAEGANETAAEVLARGQRAVVRHLDLTVLPDAADVVDELADDLGGLDVFVSNAGTGVDEPILEQRYERWRTVLAVDLDAAFLCGQRAARRMVRAGEPGRIIHVTSVHEQLPLSGNAAYAAAKGGLGLLTRVMALELAEHGITVNAVAPGEIATPLTGHDDEDPHRLERPAIPVGRPGDAREVASVIRFLASPEASYVTGASWTVDGGLSLMGPEANRRAG